jgi:hypothetical protein
VVESSRIFLYRSTVMPAVSKHLTKMAIHDFKGRVRFAVDSTRSVFDWARSYSAPAFNQTEIRDMLENARPNHFGLCDLGQVR